MEEGVQADLDVKLLQLGEALDVLVPPRGEPTAYNKDRLDDDLENVIVDVPKDLEQIRQIWGHVGRQDGHEGQQGQQGAHQVHQVILNLKFTRSW